MKVTVVGFDGATWGLLERLAEGGKMPNLAALVRRSARGPLRSVTPPVTAPAWVSMATGVNPGRHGCFDFNKPDGSLSKLRPLQSWDIAEKTFYEVLEERGKKVVLVNLPVTYPPLTNHITLTSLLTQGDEAVFPREMKSKHPALGGYRIFPDARLRALGRQDEYLRDIRAVEAARFECVKALWQEPWDCFFVVFSGTDWVSHEAFPDLMAGRWEECAGAVGMFEDADRYLGWIVDRIPSSDHLLLVSDHGFTEAKGLFYINEWLHERGFLKPDYARPAFPPSHRMEEAALEAAQGRGRKFAPGVLEAVHTRRAARFLAKVYRKLGGAWPLSLSVDAASSRAWTLTAECMGITVNEGGDGSRSEETAELVGRLIALLGELRDPEGEPVFPSVQPREAVYSGGETSKAAHVLLGSGKWGVSAAIKALQNIPFVHHPMGVHSEFGIFLGFGPAFNKNLKLTRPMEIEDVTPLIFYLLDEAFPEGLDGRLVPDLFPINYLERNPATYAPVAKSVRTQRETEAEEIQARLRGLGYMG